MERKPASPCQHCHMVFNLTVAVSSVSSSFPTLPSSVLSHPHHHTNSQLVSPWLWIQFHGGSSSELLHTSISQATSLPRDSCPRSAEPSQKPWVSSTSIFFLHFPSPMDGSCFLCCFTCVTLVQPLCLFHSSISGYPIPCIKFLINITDVESIFPTKAWLIQR